MSATNERIARKISKLVDEVSGYVYRPEHEWQIPIDEERIAIMAALGGMAIAVGRRCTPPERKHAERLAIAVANQIRDAANGSAHVAAPGACEIKT